MASPAQKMVFPTSGLNVVAGFDAQPPGTTPDALNVRGFDTLTQRLRGGRRAGSSKFSTFDFGGLIQWITPVSQAAQPVGIGGPATDLVFDVAPLSDTDDMGDGWVQLNFLANIPLSDDEFERKAAGTVETAGDGGESSRVAIVAVRPGSKVSVTGQAVPQANIATAKIDQESTLYACFLRISTDMSEALIFSLEYVSANVVRPHVYAVVEDNGTEESFPDLWTGSNLTLSGGSAASALNLTFEHLSGTSYRVQGDWVSESWTLDATISVPNLDTADNAFAGFGATRHTATSRSVVYTAATVLTEAAPSIGVSLRSHSASDANPIGSDRYYIPDGLTSIDYNRGTDTFNSSDEGPLEDASEYRGPCIDSSGAVWAGILDISTNDDLIGLILTDNPTQRPVMSSTLAAGGSIDRTFYTRVSDDFKSYVHIRLNVTNSVPDSQSNLAQTGAVVWTVISEGAIIDTGSVNYSHEQVFRLDDRIEVVDPGDDGSTDFIIRIEGVTLREFTIPAASINSANAPGLYIGGVSYRRCGFGYDRSGGASDSAGTFQWVVGELALDGGVAATDVTTSSAELVIAAAGTIYTMETGETPTTPSGGLDAVRTEFGQVMMESAYGKTYIVDGSSSLEFDPILNTVAAWTATAGTVPAGARLIARYRGRIVVSGLVTDPNNWFMSRLGDPNDWDYFPANDSDPIAPIAGNNSPAGLMGDLITALIPFSDDAMLMGGQNSIYQMTGDPAAGGAIDLVTDQTGIAFGKAWARDPDNTIYFMGNDGIYRFRFGGMPESLTKSRIDSVFKNIDLNANRVILEWDYLRNGLMVFVIDSAGTAQTAYFWDSRADAWWPDAYPATQGPSFVYAYDGPDADSKAFLLGGKDGFLRMIDDTAADDDGTAITSRIRFAQLMSADPSRELVLTELYPVMAAGSGAVTLSVYTGQSAEGVVAAATPRFTRSLVAGRNSSIRQRVRGSSLQVELSQTGSARWALNSLNAVVRTAGKVRRHGN